MSFKGVNNLDNKENKDHAKDNFPKSQLHGMRAKYRIFASF